mmetsp:Transcript_7080/g.15624  ORF Transcript_7080/g.15624 Transcript_7080/m.15624 type:complete len:1126 (+) Transcript_7080:135-3512(+)|eukprot:CAMPEP_0183717922 /NCGR_PEP_ID=MMETSP0737-20130205/11343_1 /TAXON_ID=385413 /ORGANISM="Thalassiosira miniscula, Strain CCMP1093" /LENGTH=1125 /DNA_ID=CAMNT_0025947399 /DNA_START=135 /DNA_END=3512 /DNA_ORIENTATION=-
MVSTSALVTLVLLSIPGSSAQLADDADAVQAKEASTETTDHADADGTTTLGLEEEEAENAIPNSNGNENDGKRKRPRVTLLGLDDILNLKRSGIVGLGNDYDYNANDDGDVPPRLNYQKLHADDMTEDSFYDPFAADPSCVEENDGGGDAADCWNPPVSTIDEGMVEEVVGCDDGDGAKSAGLETLAWGYGGADPDDDIEEEQEVEQERVEESGAESEEGNADQKSQCQTEKIDATPVDDIKCEPTTRTKFVDKHWGSDIDILKMRDRLRGRRGKYWDMIEQEQEIGAVGNETESNATEATHQDNRQTSPNSQDQNDKIKPNKDHERLPRPPVFLLPGLASTRLVSWKHKPCPQSPLLSDIKMLDYVWLNMNLLIQMATIDAECWNECMTLGLYQSDYDGAHDEMDAGSKGDDKTEQPSHRGCKLRPDEGLDSISSLAPGSISSNLFVGGTNTVYAWLIQWLADNLGYDVTSIVALPYDWRLSPDKMEARDGFLTMTRKKIEAAVKSNGRPGIMVAHSMGNSVFRYFLEWLRAQMREEAYERYVQQATNAAAARATDGAGGRGPFWRGGRALYRGLINRGGAASLMEGENEDHSGAEDGGLDELKWLLEPHDDSEESTGKQKTEEETKHANKRSRKYPKLYELAKAEGDTEWIDWLGKHIWTYVGLAAPLLGAPGPLRSVLSGENMGLPFTDEEARGLELSFGSTSTVNPISTKMGFCDGDDIEAGKDGWKRSKGAKNQNSNLACLEELVSGIESSRGKRNQTNPWKDFPALRLLLKGRVDFDSLFPIVQVQREFCEEDENSPCNNQTSANFGAKDVMDGRIFDQFSQIWNEKDDPLGVKLDQLRQSWWQGTVPNMLETTPDRPHIKHVILAYGTDVATEIGYVYRKTDLVQNSSATNTTTSSKKESNDPYDGLPSMTEIIWEEPQGRLVRESKVVEPATFTETLLRKKKQNRRPLKVNGESASWLHHSGDGTIPYISLMWAHTWLLHATRAMRTTTNTTASMLEGERISNPNNALDSIKVTHRPKGGNEWVEGYGADPRDEEDGDSESSSDGDTGTSHPHGTKYKPKMVRFQSSGKSRSSGMEYTTTVIEAIGVEHKETTRNYDILAAAFTDVLKFLHDDYGDI